MSIIPDIPDVQTLVQDNTLKRYFYDQLYPNLMFREEAEKTKWDAHVGDTSVQTRGSDLDPVVDPLTPGQDPIPDHEEFEQWVVTACQYGKSKDTNMMVSRAQLASKFFRDSRSMALNAGQSMDRLVRNKLFTPYLSGRTLTDNAGPSTSVVVGSLNGFTEVLKDGKVVTVSAANPKNITINGTAAQVINFTPADSAFPLGRGTLTLAASTAFAAEDNVIADDAVYQRFSGGGDDLDTLTPTTVLTPEDIRWAVSQLQVNNVPPHEDGYYHVHIDPFGVNSIFGNAEFQNAINTNYKDEQFQRFTIGTFYDCVFRRNTQVPNPRNTGGKTGTEFQDNRVTNAPSAKYSNEIGAEVRNKAGVAIQRTIVTGMGAIIEKQIPESEYISDAGVIGKVGGFTPINQYVAAADIAGVRYTLRAPIDRLGQVVSHAWSWSGDWGIPSDKLAANGTARFRRAVVINSGSAA